MTRKRKTRKITDEMFTLLDQMMASPVDPLPAADIADRLAAAHQHLENIATGAHPQLMDWRVVAMVGNVMEIMLELGIAQDPDGLLEDAFAALQDAAERNMKSDVPIRFTGPGLVAVRALVRDFGECLAEAPARTMIKVFRDTGKRVEQIHAGGKRVTDYVAQVRR